MTPIRLKYDGRWTSFPGQPRQWTVLSHIKDADGLDRFGGSFALESLVDLGIVKNYDVMKEAA